MIGYIDATDEMFGVINGVLTDTRWHALLGYNIDTRWPGDAVPAKPSMVEMWARVSKQVVTDSQACLANANGERKFKTNGLLFVQLFCPRNQPATLENGRQVAIALQKEFRKQSPSGEISFRNQMIREIETDENYPINVSTEFEYFTLDPINVLKGEGMLRQRTVTRIDANHFSIGDAPANLISWNVDGLEQSLFDPTQYSYADGIVTTVDAVAMDSTLIAIGE